MRGIRPPSRSPPLDARAQLGRSIQGLRVAWIGSLGYGSIEDEIARMCREAAFRLASQGATVRARAEPLFQVDPNEAWNEVFYGAIGQRVRQLIGGEDVVAADIDAALKSVLLSRSPVSQERVSRLRTECLRSVEQAFFDADVLALATTPVSAPAVGLDVPVGHEGCNPVDWSYFTYPFNLSGHPAVSMPVGLAFGGVPVGLQLIGRLGDERTLLAAAAAVARTSPFVSLAPLS